MDNKPTETPNPQPRPVMDIQPPQQSVPVTDVRPPQEAPVASTLPTSPSPEPVQPAPASTEESVVTSQTEVANEPATTQPPVPLAAQPPTHKHSRLPLVAIIVAVGLAGILGTFAVIAYNDSSKQPTTATTSETAPAVKETVSPTAVDETNAAVDSSLNSVDDAAEYNDNSLSDTTLGL